ncbi:hypothetical protein [Rhabdaerophilum sp.]|jgi:hypothetical protein|uniref:hypothetical protein n=1 Tax=Rhabdaerophilum sp. TaxID=2717341 RepID=UPI0038D496F7
MELDNPDVMLMNAILHIFQTVSSSVARSCLNDRGREGTLRAAQIIVVEVAA